MDTDGLRCRFQRLDPFLDERGRRLFAANEALSLGRGGTSAVAVAHGDRAQHDHSWRRRTEASRERGQFAHPASGRWMPACGKAPKRLLTMAGKLQVRVLLSIGYGAGLRVSEVVKLKVKHIDSALGVIRVEQAKGKKDRQVMLSPETLDLLREWWKVRTAKYDAGVPAGERWLFPAARGAATDAEAGHPPVPRNGRGGRDQEEGHPPYAAPQLCNPSVRPRGRYQNDLGFVWNGDILPTNNRLKPGSPTVSILSLAKLCRSDGGSPAGRGVRCGPPARRLIRLLAGMDDGTGSVSFRL